MTVATHTVKKADPLAQFVSSLATLNYMLHSLGMGYLVARNEHSLIAVDRDGNEQEHLVSGDSKEIGDWIGATAESLGGWVFINTTSDNIVAAQLGCGDVYIYKGN